MSSDFVVRLDKVGKAYQIYEKPGDRLKQFFIPKVRASIGLSAGRYYREFQAVKPFSLDIRKGETVGLIGKNGSGKSTLLQLICETLNPTTGSVSVKGKVAALLELGAGFNPDFTGRENVYMNGAILGLSSAEIDKRFDSIAAFAEIGEFIDRPVKLYSSGMFVRLAFAVVAHVDADILVIDEALAVGDAAFTQKCMRFIREFQKVGTLIFVSHDMSSVINLCQRAVWLDKGEVKMIGPSKEVAQEYLRNTLQEMYGDGVKLEDVSATVDGKEKKSEADVGGKEKSGRRIDYKTEVTAISNIGDAQGWKTGAGEIVEIALLSISGDSNSLYRGGEKVALRVRAKLNQNLERPILGFLVRDRLGQDLFGENTLPVTSLSNFSASAGAVIEAQFEFVMPLLPNGQYVVMASLADGDLQNHIQHHWLHDAMIFEVSSSLVRWGLVGISFDNVEMREIF